MIYERIKKLSVKKGISIYKLEQDLLFSNGTISKWSKSTPTSENLKKVADYFGVTMEYLLEDVKQEV